MLSAVLGGFDLLFAQTVVRVSGVKSALWYLGLVHPCMGWMFGEYEGLD